MTVVQKQNSLDSMLVDELGLLDQYDLSGIDFEEEISKLKDSGMFNFDTTKMECNLTSLLDVESDLAPPSAVKVEEPIKGNTFFNAMEKQPFSPETINLKSVSTGLDGMAQELPSGNDLQPSSPGDFLLSATPELMLQADSLTSLQPASPGIMLQADSLTSLQPASPGMMMQADSLTSLQPASPGMMLQADSLTSLQPASPGMMLQADSLTSLQPASLGIMLQADSLTSLQPASPGMMQAVPEVHLQNISPEIMLKFNSGSLLQPAFPELMTIQPSPGPILEPASTETLQPSPGATLQPSFPYSMSLVNSPMPLSNQSNFEPNQPANAAQPFKVVITSTQSELKPDGSYSPNERENIVQYPKKRGRKPKYPDGVRPRPPRKPKIYEIDQPFQDKEAEKKRKNAIVAKIHRDKQKKEKEMLSQELEEVKMERDRLKKDVEMLTPQLKDVIDERDRLMKDVEMLKETLQKTLKGGRVCVKLIPAEHN